MKPIATLSALCVLGAGFTAAANPLVTVVNETGEAWVLLSDLGHTLPGVLTASRSARDGAEGSGLARRTDPARREALCMVLNERDAVLIGMERPTCRRPRAMLHLLRPRLGFHRFEVEFRLDTRAVPAKATLVPIDDFFIPLDQDPYWLQVSADGAMVRIRRRSQAGAGAEVKAEAKAEGQAEALEDAAGPAGLEDPAGGARSQACAIL